MRVGLYALLIMLLCAITPVHAQDVKGAPPVTAVQDTAAQTAAIDSAKYLWPEGKASVSIDRKESFASYSRNWENIKLRENPIVLMASTYGDSLIFPKAKQFAPETRNPKRAVMLSLIPGMGQVYNRKYWKLPLVYGGLVACLYAVTWNNKNYGDYYDAYFDIMSDAENGVTEENYGSWVNYVPAGASATEYLENSNFQSALKRKKDYFRRYRDLSIMITVGVYALSIVDAYVDAQLFDFDITPDLSMHWSPDVMPDPRKQKLGYGLNCSFVF